MTDAIGNHYISPNNVPYMVMVLATSKEGAMRTKKARVITPEYSPEKSRGLLNPPYTVRMQSGQHPDIDVLMELRAPVVLGAKGSGDSDVDVVLDFWDARDLGVSRRHCKLIPTPEYLSVIDLESTNGTLHNSGRMELNRSYRLRAGDSLRLGELTILFRHVHRPAVAGEATPEVTKQLKDTGWLTGEDE